MNPFYLFALGFVFLAFVGIRQLDKGQSRRDERQTIIMILVCCLAGVIAIVQGTLR